MDTRCKGPGTPMIVVFGSFNVDFVMMVDRLPGPGETVLGRRYFLVQGGKGANQACAAARAGARGRVAMVGCVGRDDWGEFALDLLREAGVDLSAVGRAAASTGCASIFVDKSGQNAIAAAIGANMEARAAQVPDDWLGPDTWLVLQMEVPYEENWALIARARERGAHVVLNVAPAAAVPAEALSRTEILVVNELEAETIAKILGLAGAEPAVVARKRVRGLWPDLYRDPGGGRGGAGRAGRDLVRGAPDGRAGRHHGRGGRLRRRAGRRARGRDGDHRGTALRQRRSRPVVHGRGRPEQLHHATRHRGAPTRHSTPAPDLTEGLSRDFPAP